MVYGALRKVACMDVFESAVRSTLVLEGGYSDHPADRGGETMYGITARMARSAGYTGPMRDLSVFKARDIYRAVFWDAIRLDDVAAVSAVIAIELFDTNVNFYAGAAAMFLQRSLSAMGDTRVVLDGKIGPYTVDALKRFLALRRRDGEIVLMRCLNGLQLCDYIRQVEADPAKAAFLFGWVRARVVI